MSNTDYEGRHRDNSDDATTKGAALDLIDSVTMPIRHHKPRHSAFVCKVRAA